jgi:hypothetical protein
MAKNKKNGKEKDQREFPPEIHVAFDPNDQNNPTDLLACRTEAEAVDGDGPTRVARYRLVREGVFSKTVVEE